MDSYKLLLFLHVLAVLVAMGVTFAFPFHLAFAQRQGVRDTLFAYRFAIRLARMVIWPGAALITLLGVGLIFDDATGYKDEFPAWLMAAIPIFLATAAVDMTVMRSQLASAVAMLEPLPAGADLPAAYAPLGKRVQIIGGLEGLAVVVVAFLMVWKPGE